MANQTPFWTYRVQAPRDLVMVRQKARQAAHLLHFSPLEIACVAAGAFTVAEQAWQLHRDCVIRFQIQPNHLVVSSSPNEMTEGIADTRLLKLSKPLPEAARQYSVEDLAFLLAKINDNVPADLVGELRQQNQEVLHLLHLLNHPQDGQNRAASPAPAADIPKAG